MRLTELFAAKPCVFALEVFPPKRHSTVESVYGMLKQVGKLPVDYISVTYSAGGSGATEHTRQIARYLRDELGIEALAHLTCLHAKQDEVEKELEALRAAGIENILALRGDKNPDEMPCRDFAHASNLVAAIKASGGFCIAAACYPEGHPESASLAQDIDNLHHKLEAGAGHLVSQLFFDNGKFYRFLNLARKRGVSCPVEAGVMPVTRPEMLGRTISLSSASLPAEFSRMAGRYADNPAAFYDAGIDYAIRQCRDLIEGGVDGIHLYAMNKPDVARRVYEGIADLLPPVPCGTDAKIPGSHYAV